MVNPHPIHPHLVQPVSTVGRPLDEADTAMILIHGRGASADSILDLAKLFHRPDMAYLAPQAARNTWYPNSFMAPIPQNQPHLDGALATLDQLVKQVVDAGISAENLILAGFSQGACLASEYVARHAQRYGGLLVFSGGLIGPPATPREYAGSLDATPVFVGCSDVDFHIPLERVNETAEVLTQLGATVDKQIYAGMGHTINEDEIERAQAIVSAVGAAAA